MQNARLSPFYVVRLKPWGAEMARGVGGMREPQRRQKKNNNNMRRKRASVRNPQIYREVVVFAQDKAKELNHIVSEEVCY